MRVFVVAIAAIVLLASCATKEETAADNAMYYNLCIAAATNSGIDAAKKCGTSPATYRPSFGERYSYLRDQYQAQQQTAQAAQNPREAYAKTCYAAALQQPTYGDGFGQSLANANLAYQRCLLGLPPPSAQQPAPPAPPTQTICQPFGNGFMCNSQ